MKSRKKSVKKMYGGNDDITLIDNNQDAPIVLISSGFSADAYDSTKAVCDVLKYHVIYVKYSASVKARHTEICKVAATKRQNEEKLYDELAILLHEKMSALYPMPHVCIGKSAGGAVMLKYANYAPVSKLLLQAPAYVDNPISTYKKQIIISWNIRDAKITIDNLPVLLKAIYSTYHSSVLILVNDADQHEVHPTLLKLID